MRPAAFVTGAGSGIGRATAAELDARGYRIVAADVDGEAARDCSGPLTDARAVEVDVTDFAAVAAALDGEGAVDVLVNCAGVGSTETVVDTSEEVWERVFAVNVTGVFNACRAALPGMIERGRGSIVNVASVAGLVGLPQRAAYCASKGAVISLTRAMAVDHVGDGVRVNCVCPGTVDTPWVARLLDASGDAAAARESLAARQPMGRLGTSREIAEAIAYLADAEFATGTALVVDGGLTAA